MDATAEAAVESLRTDRKLANSLGTPESLRDLGPSLNSVGLAAERHGGSEVGEQCSEESLTIFCEVADLLGAPRTIEDLMGALTTTVIDNQP